MIIKLKQNDYGVGRKATLTNTNGPVDLTDLTVLFLFDGHEISPVIEDALNGVVSVFFESIHTVNTGIFNGEFKVSKVGSRETIPNDSYIKIEIVREGGN